METSTHYLLLLDRSGSMQRCWTATLNALDAQLEVIYRATSDQPKLRVTINLVVFNDRFETLVYQAKPEACKRFPVHHLFPEGNTGLFDAMGFSFQQLRGAMKADDIALVTVITDGMENASQHFDGPRLSALMDELKASGKWSFSFMGADFDIFEHLGKELNLEKKNTLFFSKSRIDEEVQAMSSKHKLFFSKQAKTGNADLSTFDFD